MEGGVEEAHEDATLSGGLALVGWTNGRLDCVSVMAPRVVERVGTTRVVTTGLALMAITFTWISRDSATTPYLEIVGQMILLGVASA